MEAVYARHDQYPFVYEEQSPVLIDQRGDRMTRRMTRYSRVEGDGTARLMLLFTRHRRSRAWRCWPCSTDEHDMRMAMYLLRARGAACGERQQRCRVELPGNGLTIENLIGEVLDDYRYARRRSRLVRGVPHHVIDVFDLRDDAKTARPRRRHFVRADNLYITRTDHFDQLGRVEKRQTTHDLRPVDGPMWRGDMILMEDYRHAHRSLLKIDRRVFSRDYVPEEMFGLEWLVANRPPPEPRAPENEYGDGLQEIVLPELVRLERAP